MSSLLDVLRQLGAAPDERRPEAPWSMQGDVLRIESLFGGSLEADIAFAPQSDESIVFIDPPELAACGTLWLPDVDDEAAFIDAVLDAHSTLRSRLETDLRTLAALSFAGRLVPPEPRAVATEPLDGRVLTLGIGADGDLELLKVDGLELGATERRVLSAPEETDPAGARGAIRAHVAALMTRGLLPANDPSLEIDIASEVDGDALNPPSVLTETLKKPTRSTQHLSQDDIAAISDALSDEGVAVDDDDDDDAEDQERVDDVDVDDVDVRVGADDDVPSADTDPKDAVAAARTGPEPSADREEPSYDASGFDDDDGISEPKDASDDDDDGGERTVALSSVSLAPRPPAGEPATPPAVVADEADEHTVTGPPPQPSISGTAPALGGRMAPPVDRVNAVVDALDDESDRTRTIGGAELQRAKALFSSIEAMPEPEDAVDGGAAAGDNSGDDGDDVSGVDADVPPTRALHRVPATASTRTDGDDDQNGDEIGMAQLPGIPDDADAMPEAAPTSVMPPKPGTVVEQTRTQAAPAPIDPDRELSKHATVEIPPAQQPAANKPPSKPPSKPPTKPVGPPASNEEMVADAEELRTRGDADQRASAATAPEPSADAAAPVAPIAADDAFDDENDVKTRAVFVDKAMRALVTRPAMSTAEREAARPSAQASMAQDGTGGGDASEAPATGQHADAWDGESSPPTGPVKRPFSAESVPRGDLLPPPTELPPEGGEDPSHLEGEAEALEARARDLREKAAVIRASRPPQTAPPAAASVDASALPSVASVEVEALDVEVAAEPAEPTRAVDAPPQREPRPEPRPEPRAEPKTEAREPRPRLTPELLLEGVSFAEVQAALRADQERVEATQLAEPNLGDLHEVSDSGDVFGTGSPDAEGEATDARESPPRRRTGVVALVLEDARARERLSKRLGPRVQRLVELPHVDDVLGHDDLAGLDAAVLVRPRLDERTRAGLKRLVAANARPRILLLSTEGAFLDVSGVDLRVSLGERASEVAQQVLDGLGQLGVPLLQPPDA